MMNFDAKYEEILDKVTDGVYELADTFAEEQVHNFAKWLGDKGFDAEVLKEHATEFIKEQRS